MLKLVVVTAQGEEKTLECHTPGTPVMRLIKDAGLHDMLALCGGYRECGTCHVHVGSEFLSRLPTMSREESELLCASAQRTSNSRLSCQISLTHELDGLRVTIVREG
jgi:2Fe-2S ferredoxin